jgi:hypothetical protein
VRNSPFQQTRFEVASERDFHEILLQPTRSQFYDIENPMELFPRTDARLALYGGNLPKAMAGGKKGGSNVIRPTTILEVRRARIIFLTRAKPGQRRSVLQLSNLDLGWDVRATNQPLSCTEGTDLPRRHTGGIIVIF